MVRLVEPPKKAALSKIRPTIELGDGSTSLWKVGSAEILFGPGADVIQIFTDMQSPWIHISNLPRNIRANEVRAFVAPLPGVCKVETHKLPGDSESLMASRVLFASHELADNAVSLLHGQTMHCRRIVVRIDRKRLESNSFLRQSTRTPTGADVDSRSASLEGHSSTAAINGCAVKVSWYAPTATLYVTYTAARFALEQARRLTGRSFHSRRVKAVPIFSKEKDWAKVAQEDGGFTIRLEGLWANLDADWESLCSFVRSRDIVVQPQYLLSAGLATLREHLSDVAPLETFKLLPYNVRDLKCHAFAHYTTPAAAAAAVKIFEGCREKCLGGSPVWVSRRLAINYCITTRLAQVLQAELNSLHSWSKDEPNLRVRQHEDASTPGFVRISLSCNETKLIAAAKAQLDRALAGEPLRDLRGDKLWDSSFGGGAWIQFAESVAKRVGVCVRIDNRTSSILLYGPDYSRDEASSLMRREWAKIAQLQHTINIPVALLGWFRTGVPSILENASGASRIDVNLAQRLLIFHGDDEGAKHVKQVMEAMRHNSIEPTEATSGLRGQEL
ncbi:hypothetical protein FRC07_011774 [Ceratobasidium sp. 392]|nr:hypothetical protein FRC07_011774 [Ceratobasidium sp. 392]